MKQTERREWDWGKVGAFIGFLLCVGIMVGGCLYFNILPVLGLM